MSEPVVGLSRAELEPLLARRVAVGDDVGADEIRVELAGRTWQGINPYAEWLPVPVPEPAT